MNAAAVVLASSPVIGPLTMATLAQALRERGLDVSTPPAHVELDRYVAAVCEERPPRPFVLVGFSAAGPRLFAVAQAASPSAIVFMDARLPSDGVAPDAEPAFAATLDRLPLDDGLLPPWPEWWPTGVLETLVADPHLRRRFVTECPRVPRAMFGTPLPAPAYDGPCAFLAFGDTYADQRAIALDRGWPVTTVEHVRHLTPLVEPDTVADALIALIAQL